MNAKIQRKAIDLLHDVAFQVRAVNSYEDMLRALRLAQPILEDAARSERVRNRLALGRNVTCEHALNATNAAIATAEAND